MRVSVRIFSARNLNALRRIDSEKGISPIIKDRWHFPFTGGSFEVGTWIPIPVAGPCFPARLRQGGKFEVVVRGRVLRLFFLLFRAVNRNPG